MSSPAATIGNLLDAMSMAFEEGKLLGSTISGSAVDCPLDHSRLMLRLSWMNGFSKGRCSPSPCNGWADLPKWQ